MKKIRKKAYSYFRKFRTLTGTEKYILVKALLLSLVFFFTVRLLPLKYYIHLLKSRSVSSPVRLNLDDDHRMITKSIARLEKVVPWPMTCLNKVLTARYLYSSLGIYSSINLSLYRNISGKNCAHASLRINGTTEYLPVNENNTVKIFL